MGHGANFPNAWSTQLRVSRFGAVGRCVPGKRSPQCKFSLRSEDQQVVSVGV